MSFFAEYVKETRGMECLETEHGFATYSITGEECYIEDIYIKPESRRTGAAPKFADQIKQLAKAQGAKRLVGTVNGLFKDPTGSTRNLLAYGFKITNIHQNVIVMKMEI